MNSTEPKSGRAWAIVVGVILMVAGVILRVAVDGNLIQLPVVIMVFGGFWLIMVAVRRRNSTEAADHNPANGADSQSGSPRAEPDE